jgi:hypothetical protein
MPLFPFLKWLKGAKGDFVVLLMWLAQGEGEAHTEVTVGELQVCRAREAVTSTALNILQLQGGIQYTPPTLLYPKSALVPFAVRVAVTAAPLETLQGQSRAYVTLRLGSLFSTTTRSTGLSPV